MNRNDEIEMIGKINRNSLTEKVVHGVLAYVGNHLIGKFEDLEGYSGQ